MNFERKSNENYISSKSGDFAQLGVNYPNSDNPRGFTIYEHISEYRIGISMNYSEAEEFPVTYVQWNEFDTDTLKCKIYRTNSLVTVEKVWLNDELIWDARDEVEPYYEMIKDY